MNLEWLKKHRYAAAAGILVVLVIFYVLLKRGGQSSASGLGGAIAAQNQGQLQMAQLNAQLSAQSQQTQAQLASQEFQTNAQTQAQQDSIAAQLASEILPIQAETPLYEQEIAAQAAQQTALIPLEQQALAISRTGGRADTGVEELMALLGEQNAASTFGAASQQRLSVQAQNNPWNTFTTGLFGTLSKFAP